MTISEQIDKLISEHRSKLEDLKEIVYAACREIRTLEYIPENTSLSALDEYIPVRTSYEKAFIKVKSIKDKIKGFDIVQYYKQYNILPPIRSDYNIIVPGIVNTTIEIDPLSDEGIELFDKKYFDMSYKYSEEYIGIMRAAARREQYYMFRDPYGLIRRFNQLPVITVTSTLFEKKDKFKTFKTNGSATNIVKKIRSHTTTYQIGDYVYHHEWLYK